ncbi:MAG: hypothetical protein WBH85_19880 [Thermoanaerobaculia bacterium]
MRVGRSVVTVAAVAVVLAFGLGCRQPELSSLPVSSEERTTPVERSAGSDLSDIDEFSVLPFFVPAMGPDARAADCDLSGDPYSSCI